MKREVGLQKAEAPEHQLKLKFSNCFGMRVEAQVAHLKLPSH